MFLSGTTCESLIHKLGYLKPRTTHDLLDIATNHASSEEVVGAVFSGGWDMGKAKHEDQGEGPSMQKGKKNKKDRRRSTNLALVVVVDRAGKQPQQGQPDHFDKLMENAYPVKHLYKDCELLKHFLRQAGKPKEGKGKEDAAKKGGTAGKDGDSFPDPKECLMIFGGSDAIHSKR